MNQPVPAASLLIADEHPLMCMGIRAMLKGQPHLTFLDQVLDLQEAVEKTLHLRPHILILGQSAGSNHALNAVRLLISQHCPSKIIINAGEVDANLVHQVLTLGLHGLVCKRSSEQEILRCVTSVQKGHQYISKACYERAQHSVAPTRAAKPPLEILTPTERQLLKLIAQKKTTVQIADLLHKSPKTIENHRYRMCRKLELKGNNGLLTYAMDHKAWLG